MTKSSTCSQGGACRICMFIFDILVTFMTILLQFKTVRSVPDNFVSPIYLTTHVYGLLEETQDTERTWAFSPLNKTQFFFFTLLIALMCLIDYRFRSSQISDLYTLFAEQPEETTCHLFSRQNFHIHKLHFVCVIIFASFPMLKDRETTPVLYHL